MAQSSKNNCDTTFGFMCFRYTVRQLAHDINMQHCSLEAKDVLAAAAPHITWCKQTSIYLLYKDIYAECRVPFYSPTLPYPTLQKAWACSALIHQDKSSVKERRQANRAQMRARELPRTHLPTL